MASTGRSTWAAEDGRLVITEAVSLSLWAMGVASCRSVDLSGAKEWEIGTMEVLGSAIGGVIMSGKEGWLMTDVVQIGEVAALK